MIRHSCTHTHTHTCYANTAIQHTYRRYISGEQQFKSGSCAIRLAFNASFQLSGRTPPAVFVTARIRPVVARRWIFPLASRAVTHTFTPFGSGWVHCLAPEASLIRGILTGLMVFLVMPDACVLGPATGPTLKTTLCQICAQVGRMINTVVVVPFMFQTLS